MGLCNIYHPSVNSQVTPVHTFCHIVHTLNSESQHWKLQQKHLDVIFLIRSPIVLFFNAQLQWLCRLIVIFILIITISHKVDSPWSSSSSSSSLDSPWPKSLLHFPAKRPPSLPIATQTSSSLLPFENHHQMHIRTLGSSPPLNFWIPDMSNTFFIQSVRFFFKLQISKNFFVSWKTSDILTRHRCPVKECRAMPLARQGEKEQSRQIRKLTLD